MASDGLSGDVAVALDQMGILKPGVNRVTKAAEAVGDLALVEALTEEEFDELTISEANAAIDSMHAAVAAVEAAGLSADVLSTALTRL